MDLAAILHRPMSEYAFPLDETHYIFRLRAKRGDLVRCTFFYADRADMASELPFTAVPMSLIRSDLLHDWFEITLETNWQRIAYYFLMDDGEQQIRYAGECFEPMTAHIERSEYFQYPFNHKADLHVVPDWVHNAVVYNIFPDSFADGQRSLSGTPVVREYNGISCQTNYGGTIQGIRENLDYLADLGINCLYLNPVFTAGAYHKYDLLDYYHIDPCFGKDEDFLELVQAAHAHGIRIVIDGVFNHVSWNHFSFQDVLAHGKESPYYDWFYELPEPLLLPEGNEPPAYVCFSYVANMPKTNTACPSLNQYFCDVGAYWVREFDVDGWRLDVANEVDDSFLRSFRKAVKTEKADALVIGEVWENAAHYMSGDMLDSAMNYDFRRFCTQFFAEGVLDAPAFDLRLTSMLMRYHRQALDAQLNLLDGHDVSRFLTLCDGNLDKMELAILFQMTFIGMPNVFYGDEKGASGMQESEYRRPMPWKSTSPLETVYRRLITLRKTHSVLRRGEFRTVLADGGVFGYERFDEHECIRITVNAGTQNVPVESMGHIILSKNIEQGNLLPGGYIVQEG